MPRSQAGSDSECFIRSAFSQVGGRVRARESTFFAPLGRPRPDEWKNFISRPKPLRNEKEPLS